MAAALPCGGATACASASPSSASPSASASASASAASSRPDSPPLKVKVPLKPLPVPVPLPLPQAQALPLPQAQAQAQAHAHAPHPQLLSSLSSSSPSSPSSPSSSSSPHLHAAAFSVPGGRPAWYVRSDAAARRPPFVIGVAGGTASGKTEVTHKLLDAVGVRWCVVLSMDSFYRPLEEPADRARAARSEYNFDHPDAFDVVLILEMLRRLRRCEPVDVPRYDFVTHTRARETTRIYGADVVIFEGILALYFDSLRAFMDMRIFVDEDDDVRLARRLRRDITERGRTIAGVLRQYVTFVKPAFDSYVAPSRKHADIIIPRAARNEVAIRLIAEHLRRKLEGTGFLREQLVADDGVPPDAARLHALSNLVVMPETTQVRALHTIIRNRRTPRSDFIFYSNRLSRLLIERALSQLEFVPRIVTTPTGEAYPGLKMEAALAGVSIVRAGEALEAALHEVCGDVPVCKILIQSVDGEPHLFFCKLVEDIAQRTVLLMDAVVGTGATAIMAIHVLLDHGVDEGNILFVTLIASAHAVLTLSRRFPAVRIVTTAIDPRLDRNFYICPGIGNFGDRYFGTD